MSVLSIKTKMLSAVTLLLLAPAAFAGLMTWNFNAGANCADAATCFGNARTYTPVGQPTVSANSWANTVGAANTALETGYLASWSRGLGMYNRDYANGTDANEHSSPEHAIDNNGRFEMVLLSFSQMVELQSMRIGWKGADSDMSVLAYTGIGLPSIASNTWAGLLSSGWSIVGNYANVGTNVNYNINSAHIASRYWLVGAYNNAFGTGSGLNVGNDYIKLSAVFGQIAIPAPAAWLLILSGFYFMNSRKRKA